MHMKEQPSEENELLGEESVWLEIWSKRKDGMDSDWRRSSEALASKTWIVSPGLKASRERAGRNRKRAPSVISAGADRDSTFAGVSAKVNSTSRDVVGTHVRPGGVTVDSYEGVVFVVKAGSRKWVFYSAGG